jgi:nitrogen fixation NifU-like protein
MKDANRSVEGYNPLCGDHYTIYLKMNGETIEDVSFSGAGCAISKASASVMTSIVKGKTRAEAEHLFSDFHNLVRGKYDPDEEMDRWARMAPFSGVSEFPARVKCASLPWHTLRAALDASRQTVSTE